MDILPTEDDIAYFSSLSDHDLINVVLPQFSLNILENLCSSNVKFNRICHDDQLWHNKVMNELHSFTHLKPTDITWKDYYLSFIRPVYCHGDIITFVLYSPDIVSNVIDCIVPYINSSVNIIFIDQKRDPVFIVNYPSCSMTVISSNYISVDKIVLSDQNDISKQTIFQELTSPLGTPPIYGIISYNDNLYILRSDRDTKTYLCNEFSLNELHEILASLGIDDDVYKFYRVNNLCVLIQKKLREIGHIV